MTKINKINDLINCHLLKLKIFLKTEFPQKFSSGNWLDLSEISAETLERTGKQ